MQLYLDQFFTAEVGAAVNDADADCCSPAQTTPEDAAAAITAVGRRLTDVEPITA